MHSKLNCCLFYSVGVKAPDCRWMLEGATAAPRMLKSAADTTLLLKDAPLDFPPAKCHGNCEDLYQWESADEVTRLSDLTDLIRWCLLHWRLAGRPISLECPTSGGSEQAFLPWTTQGADLEWLHNTSSRVLALPLCLHQWEQKNPNSWYNIRTASLTS